MNLFKDKPTNPLHRVPLATPQTSTIQAVNPQTAKFMICEESVFIILRNIRWSLAMLLDLTQQKSRKP